MKNKLIAFLSVGFALFFMVFVFRVTNEMSNSKKVIANSSNVVDVTEIISTHLLVSKTDMPVDGEWTRSHFEDKEWDKIQIPSYQIVQHKNFQEGNFAYYRIKLPRKAFENLNHLKNETSLALLVIYFSKLDIIINGNLYGTNKPSNSVEASVIVPVKENLDNIICIKGYIGTGDTGIDHRSAILLGRSAELNALHSADYKSQTAFQLVFILCKGSILFIFALIFLLLKVETSFEKFFVFGLCAVIEELIAGEYLYGPLNFNQMVYLYNFVNFGAAVSVFLFFSELLKSNYKVKLFGIFFGLLFVVSTTFAMDALYWNHFIDLTKFMKFWNLLIVSILIYCLPRVLKFDRILFAGLSLSIVLYVWGTLPSNNIGLNFKAYGNLLLFFMVAYQTFALFRREQDLLQAKERQLFEQEKDVAIGKTASLLAHDVRKPLEQIRLVMDRMLSGEADKEFLNIAKTDIDVSISAVDRQVNDIMNINKTNEVSLDQISFYKLLAHSVKQVMSVHQEMDLKLEYRFEADLKVLGESSRLSGSLVNLITNAVEAIRDIGNTYKGKIRFSTACNSKDFHFKILNDGPQIPEEIMENIFKPLFTHGKASGTGLGLASVAKSISEHKGSLRIYNTQEGVEYSVVLQIGTESDIPGSYGFQPLSKNYNYNSDKSASKEGVQHLRILLLENDQHALQYFEAIISELPYKTKLQIAEDQKAAEEHITRSRFDIYLLNADIGGLQLKSSSLSFLSNEVIVYTKSKVSESSDSNLKFLKGPASFNDLIQACEAIYPTRIKILFVDDTKLFRVAWQMFHGDHNIKCVASPEEALQLLSETTAEFGAYILDYHFSNSSLNGEQLANRILEVRNDAFILISSSIDQKLGTFRSISKRDYEVRKLF